MLKIIFSKILETIINQVFVLDPLHTKMLLRHDGKVIQITFIDLCVTLFLMIKPEKVYIYSNYTDLPDTKITGSSLSFFKQMQATSPQGDIDIQGDIELAQDLQHFFNKFEIPWEEYLSYIFGDFTANKAMKFIMDLKKSIVIHQKRGLEDIRDYLQEEKRLFPTPEEIEDFYEEIVLIRNNIDRLEAKLNRLTEDITR